MRMKKWMLLASLSVAVACSKSNVENHYLDSSSGSSEPSTKKEISSSNHEGSVELSLKHTNQSAQFFIHRGKMPQKTSVDYFSVVEKNTDENKRMLFVDGLVIRIANQSQTDIQIKENLSYVEINAEELIIEKPLRFPGANVVINAKKLLFKSDGLISSRPLKIYGRAEQTKDGKKGIDAGKIILNVAEIELGEKQIRFDLAGGEGQDAGMGIPGKAGKSVADYGDGVVGTCVTTIVTCHESEIGPVEVSRIGPTCNTEIPSSGEKGIMAGSPGAGGNGGTLLINSKNKILADYINVATGVAGSVAPKTLGGLAGSPKVFYENYITQNKSQGNCSRKGGGKLSPKNYPGFVGKIKIGETQTGLDIESPAEPKELAQVGTITVDNDLTFSYSGKLLSHRLNFAKDLYRNNFFEEALAELKETEDHAYFNTDAVSMMVHKEATQLLNQLRAHKDIDGLALNHIPDLSLPKIISAYQKEINTSFETLKFTSRFLRDVYSVKEKSEKLLEKKAELSEEIVTIHQLNQKAHTELSEVVRISSEVESHKVAFDEALKKLEQEIEDEARRNIHSREKKKKLLGAIRLVANLAKVFPAGQPAVGAIGTGIDSIVTMSEKEDVDWQDRLQEGYEIYGDLRKSLNSENWKKSKNDWNENYKILFYEKFKEANPQIEKNRFEKYLKETISKTKPMVSEINKYYKDVWKKQVPKSEYEAEVQKIKEQHPRFQFAIAKLDELQRKKEELDNVLNKNMAIINGTESEIYRVFIAMEAAESERASLVDKLNFDVTDSIKIINDRAKLRLKEYKKLLIKAYNYRLLIPFKGSYDLEKLDEQFQLFAKSNGETIDGEMLKRLYFEDLNQIAEGILESLNSGILREYETSISYELNANEIKALNDGQKIYFNPELKGLIQSDEENLRIESINVDLLEAELKDERKVLDIMIEQVGKVEIERFGHLYVFSPSTSSVQWKTRYEPLTGNLSAINESKSLGTLFDVLFPSGVGETELYAKPALRGNYLVKLSENVKDLKKLRFNIKYTYSVKK